MPTISRVLRFRPLIALEGAARRILCLLLLCLSASVLAATAPANERGAEQVDDGLEFPATDWPWWRGPHRNGTADPTQSLPTQWSETENVAWKSEIPGRGHGTPIVVGDHIYLASADDESGAQFVLCYARGDGSLLWRTVVHPSGGMQKNTKSSLASSSLAGDGERVFINFPNSGAVYTTALSSDGEILWQTKVTDYEIHQGYGSSPALYRSLVIASADNKGGGAIVAMNRETGDVVWRHERPEKPNYPSPIIQHVDGRDQLIMTGCDLVTSLDPMTGRVLWEIAEGTTTECVTSTMAVGDLIFSTGGYPENHMTAIRADGSGEIVWNSNTRLYVPSLLVQGDFLYGVLDAGVAVCWRADSGEEVWKSRLGGTFTASPVLVGDKIVAVNEDGEAFIYRATPDRFELLGQNDLGDQVYATPVVVGGQILMRVAIQEGDQRREVLYCIGDAT